MSFPNKILKANVLSMNEDQKNQDSNYESNTKIINSLLGKSHDNDLSNHDKSLNNLTNKDNNQSHLENSSMKDVEILNNITNKISKGTIKKKPNMKKTASCEDIRSLIDNKNKEIEIYNKINNFSVKYTDRIGSINKSARKSVNKNLTPQKNKENYMSDNQYNTNNCNFNNTKNNSFNDIKHEEDSKEKKTIFDSKYDSYYNFETNDQNKQTGFNPMLSLKPNNGDSLINNAPHEAIKEREEDGEIYNVSDEDDHLPDTEFNKNIGINRSLIIKLKAPSVEEIEVPDPVFEEKEENKKEESHENEFNHENQEQFNQVNKLQMNKSLELKNSANPNYLLNHNMSSPNLNSAKRKIRKNNSVSTIDKDKDKDLLKVLNNIENEINKSSFNNFHNSKSQISNVDGKNFQNYDLTHLSYDLVKEYSHLKIDKDEEFMRRMLFDIFKRQTKDKRLEKLIEKNKIKIDESDRIKTFNRLIEDANRRLEAQDKIEDMKVKLIKSGEDEKKISEKEWEEIYKRRFINHKQLREKWIREKQIEKEKIENRKEEEILNSCKHIKKPSKNVEQFCNKMYEEAKRRQIKQQKKKENFEAEEKIIMEKNNTFAPNLSKDYKNEKSAILNNTKSKIQTKYNFQADFNSNNNISDNEISNRSINKKTNNSKISNNNQIHNESNKKSIYHSDFKEEKERQPLNISMELRKIENSPSKRKNEFKDIQNSTNKKDISPSKIKKDSDKKLNNTEFNNLRFEYDPSESKKNLRNSLNASIDLNNCNLNNLINNAANNSVNKDLKETPSKVLEKTPSKIIDYSSNLFSVNIKNMYDIQNNNFDVEDEDIVKDIPKPYKIRAKKPSYKIVPVGFSNTKMKFLPDHIAFNVVDNILNPKIHDD